MHIAAMKLEHWMIKARKSDTDVAADLGCDRSTVSRWRRDKARPDLETMEVIRSYTKGRVSPRDFLRIDGMTEAAE